MESFLQIAFWFLKHSEFWTMSKYDLVKQMKWLNKRNELSINQSHFRSYQTWPRVEKSRKNPLVSITWLQYSAVFCQFSIHLSFPSLLWRLYLYWCWLLFLSQVSAFYMHVLSFLQRVAFIPQSRGIMKKRLQLNNWKKLWTKASNLPASDSLVVKKISEISWLGWGLC